MLDEKDVRMRILAVTFCVVMACGGVGAAAGQDAQQLLDQAAEALRDLVPEEQPTSPPADMPAEPPMPMPRPAAMDEAQTPADDTPPLPETRPDGADATPVSDEPASDADRVYQAACPAVLSGLVEADMLPPIEEGPQCGLQSPLEVTAVAIAGRSVPLSQPATVNCAMAGELARWAARIDAYTEATFNSGVAEILSGTSYFCRARNNVEGADISEHGFGNALDVTGFRLESGEQISLPEDWSNGTEADAMGYAHDTACGFFTTVLGPDANALHADHLHLDLGCHGRTCTARLCE